MVVSGRGLSVAGMRSMVRSFATATTTAVTVLGLVACGGADGETQPRPPPITDTDSLITNFRAQGTAVEIVGPVRQPFFAVDGTEVHLREASVQIFQFVDETAAAAAAEGIKYDGSSIDGISPDWTGPPHFFKIDRLITLYVGDDANVLERLYGIFGPQLAGQ